MIVQNIILQTDELLDNEVEISLNSSAMPLADSLTKVGRCIVCYCLNGWAEVEVNLIKHRLVRGEIIILFPTQIVEQTRVSEDLSVMYFSISPVVLQEVCFRFPPDFLTFLRQHFYYQVGEERLQEEQVRFAVFRQKFSDVGNLCRREIMLNLFRIFFLELYDRIRRDELAHSTAKPNRKTDLFEAFTRLVMEHYATYRDVNFYARQLCITPKYLSMITQEFSGYGAKQWIDDYVMLELKIRLKSTRDTIQCIADDLHFPDQAFFCKYFKTREGLSPTDYRKT